MRRQKGSNDIGSWLGPRISLQRGPIHKLLLEKKTPIPNLKPQTLNPRLTSGLARPTPAETKVVLDAAGDPAGRLRVWG